MIALGDEPSRGSMGSRRHRPGVSQLKITLRRSIPLWGLCGEAPEGRGRCDVPASCCAGDDVGRVAEVGRVVVVLLVARSCAGRCRRRLRLGCDSGRLGARGGALHVLAAGQSGARPPGGAMAGGARWEGGACDLGETAVCTVWGSVVGIAARVQSAGVCKRRHADGRVRCHDDLDARGDKSGYLRTCCLRCCRVHSRP